MKRRTVTLLVSGAIGFVGINAVADLPIPSLDKRSLIAAQDQPKAEDHETAKSDLGTQKIGGFDVKVGQVAEAKPGEEAVFIIAVKGTGKPKAVRAWIGIESGQGSIRTMAEEEKEGEWHAHHQVSKPMPNNSKLWVELETAAGKQKASFEFKQ